MRRKKIGLGNKNERGIKKSKPENNNNQPKKPQSKKSN
jgi:hypothetical protein